MAEQTTTQSPAPAQRDSSAKWYIALVIAVIVSAGAGLVAGMQIGKATNSAGQPQSMGTMPGMRGSMGAMRGGFGTVTAVSDSSITIESRMGRMSRSSDAQGSTKTYKITTDTKVTNNRQTATIGDVKAGDTVLVRTSDSASDTATAIELNPQLRGGPGMDTSDESQSNTDDATGQNG